VVDCFRIQPFIGCLTVQYLVQKIFRRRVSSSPKKRKKNFATGNVGRLRL
jgi:hypothetical protein